MACAGQIEPEPQVDEDGEPIPMPEAFDVPLRLERIESSAEDGRINARPY